MAAPRRIAVYSVGRSDFGRYRSILRCLDADPEVELDLLAGGSHFAPRFGTTIREIEDSGFDWTPGLGSTLASGSPASVGKTIGLGTISLAQYFGESPPDMLVVLGDRFETLAGPCAAIGFNIPVVHIHGGAVTEGAIDELVRHAMTKMSHYHLVSTDAYAERVKQLGEEPWRVHTVGAPGLDELADIADMSVEATSAAAGLELAAPTLLVTYHPVTVEVDDIARQVDNLVDALAAAPQQVVLTYPGPDRGAETIIAKFTAFAASQPDRVRLIDSASTNLYVNLMKHAQAMVGNSSSGIVEAATFRLPVVNIGTRQDGKIMPANVITVGYGTDEISAAIGRATSDPFRLSLRELVNPYGDGRAGERIAGILKSLPIDDRLMRKKFVDLWN